MQLSLNLFASKGLSVSPDDAKMFYDIFDAVDLYKNATLSIGEFAGGLSSFFGGTPEARANAVYDAVTSSSYLSKDMLQSVIKPYVWCMVPPNAAALRPILLPYVTERIFEEITAGSTTGCISREQLKYWMFRGSAMMYGSGIANPMIMPEVTGNAIAERAATHVDMAVQTAYAEYSARMGLREYGQQTWSQNYPGQSQQLRDIGVARYVGGAAMQSSVAQPTTWNNIGQQATVMVSSLQQTAADFGQQATVLFDDLMARDRAASTYSTYSVDSSIIGTRSSYIGTTTISPQAPTMGTRTISNAVTLPPTSAPIVPTSTPSRLVGQPGMPAPAMRYNVRLT